MFSQLRPLSENLHDVGIEYEYLNNSDVYKKLVAYSKLYPTITRLRSIGQSVKGQQLYVLTINRDPYTYTPLQPHVRIAANMHGNEAVGRHLVMALIDTLTKNYQVSSRITSAIESTVIHLMPTLNPDGFSESNEGDCRSAVGRYNNNDMDLNRNFPMSLYPAQPETEAMIQWMTNETHVLAANIHGGALLVNIPWDATPTGSSRECPDNDVFRYLALNYSYSHPTMHRGYYDCDSKSFLDGITIGHDWYPIQGGLQDYTYARASGYEVTLEVSCCKYPKSEGLKEKWEENKQALLNYVYNVHIGVKGLVKDQSRQPISKAIIVVVGRESIEFKTTQYGEYWKLLLPGEYQLKVSANGYITQTKTFSVSEGNVTRLDFILDTLTNSQPSLHKCGFIPHLFLLTTFYSSISIV